MHIVSAALMPPYAVPRREWHQTAKFHLISHSGTASPRGEAECSLRPGGEGGATRRMRASLAVSSHQIQRIGGMRHAALRSASPGITSCRELSPHQSLRDSPFTWRAVKGSNPLKHKNKSNTHGVTFTCERTIK